METALQTQDRKMLETAQARKQMLLAAAKSQVLWMRSVSENKGKAK